MNTIDMNTIVNQTSSYIIHEFSTGSLEISFGTDKTTLNIKFKDEFNNCYLYTGKQFDNFVSKWLKRDLNRFITFFENKDNFEFNKFNKFNNLLKLKISFNDEYSFTLMGFSFKIINPINLELILNKFDPQEIAGIFLTKDLIELVNKNTSLKRNHKIKYDELYEEVSKLKNLNTALLNLNTSLKQENTSLKQKNTSLKQELKSIISDPDYDPESEDVSDTESDFSEDFSENDSEDISEKEDVSEE